MRKILTCSILAVLIISCANSNKNEGGSNDSAGVDGAKIYKMNCTLCHGANGKLGANGSKDLTASPLGLEERIAIITNGKGAMASYKAILSEDEIKAVAKYTLTLK